MKDKLQEIWDNAIAILEPTEARTLMKQKCGLVALDSDNKAIIVVHAVELMELLEGIVTNIETAFTQVCQQQIKVVLKTRELKPEQINYKRRSSLNDDEIMTILEGFNLTVFSYTGDFDCYSLGQKAFYLQNMISLILRFENIRDLGSLTKEKIAFTKELLLNCHTKVLQKAKITGFNPYLNYTNSPI